jgi:5-methylcytosine-specific restriction endonuclease McrA
MSAGICQVCAQPAERLSKVVSKKYGVEFWRCDVCLEAVRSSHPSRPEDRTRLRPRALKVYERDGRCCRYCGKALEVPEVTLDHVIPRCRGGQGVHENLVAACVECNRKKADRTPDEAKMPLRDTANLVVPA